MTNIEQAITKIAVARSVHNKLYESYITLQAKLYEAEDVINKAKRELDVLTWTMVNEELDKL